MLNYASKQTFGCHVSIKCRKLPAKVTIKKEGEGKHGGVCFFSPTNNFYTHKSGNFRDILTTNLTLYSQGRKGYLT